MWDEMLTKSVETNKALESKGITGEKLAESVCHYRLQGY